MCKLIRSRRNLDENQPKTQLHDFHWIHRQQQRINHENEIIWQIIDDNFKQIEFIWIEVHIWHSVQILWIDIHNEQLRFGSNQHETHEQFLQDNIIDNDHDQPFCFDDQIEVDDDEQIEQQMLFMYELIMHDDV